MNLHSAINYLYAMIMKVVFVAAKKASHSLGNVKMRAAGCGFL